MLKKLFIALIAVVVAFAAYVALQPADFSVTRSATIAAPPSAVFPHVNNFRKWEAWSPWAKRDPDAKTTYGGPEAGEGATFSWDGNAEVGAGTMTIVDSEPDREVDIKLDFTEPMEGTSDVAFRFQPEGAGTKVTWTMAGENGFIPRAFCTLMTLFTGQTMDDMIGNDYEAGLANLQRVVESGAGTS